MMPKHRWVKTLAGQEVAVSAIELSFAVHYNYNQLGAATKDFESCTQQDRPAQGRRLAFRFLTGAEGSFGRPTSAGATNVKETAMKILVYLSSTMISEAIESLLSENGIEARNRSHNGRFDPDIVLADVNTVCDDLFSTFPKSKVLLLDTGIKKERLAEALLSYEISGIISVDTGFNLFKKALTVINEGRVWIDKSTIKSFLTESDLVTRKDTVRRRKAATND